MTKTINLHGHTYEVMRPSYARQAYNKFLRSNDLELIDVYTSYSRAKANAYKYCKARQNEFNSYNGVIASYCSTNFTYAFTGCCEGKEYFVFITKTHDYAIALEDF